jgi:hypothetical protein
VIDERYIEGMVIMSREGAVIVRCVQRFESAE